MFTEKFSQLPIDTSLLTADYVVGLKSIGGGLYTNVIFPKSALGGGGTPGGSNGDVQYNNHGTFGGATITTDGNNLFFASGNVMYGATNTTGYIDTNLLELIDSSAQASVDWGNRLLIDSNAITSFDFQHRKIYDKNNVLAIDLSGFSSPINRKLYDSAQGSLYDPLLSVDFNARQLWNYSPAILFECFGFCGGLITGSTITLTGSGASVTLTNLIHSHGSFPFTNLFGIQINSGTPVPGDTYNGWHVITTYGIMSSGNQSVVTVDWGQCLLTDNENVPSVDWEGRFEYDSSGGLSIDYGQKNLYDGSSSVPGSGQSIDYANRELFDNSGQVALIWAGGLGDNRLCIDSTGHTTIDWNQLQLLTQPGLSPVPVVDWLNQNLNDRTDVLSVDWQQRQLVENDGTTVAFDWSTSTAVNNTTKIIGKLSGANFNSTADQAITLTTGTKYIVTDVLICNCSTSMTSALDAEIWGSAGRSGQEIMSTNDQSPSPTTGVPALNSGTYINATSPSLTSPGNYSFNMFIGNNHGRHLVISSSTVYFSLGTPEGSAATADVYIFGMVIA